MKAKLLDIITATLVAEGEFTHSVGSSSGSFVTDEMDPFISGRTYILSLQNGAMGQARLHLKEITDSGTNEQDANKFGVELIGNGW